MIAFPANPVVNDTYTASGRTWKWTGSVWQLQPRTLTSADITDFAEAVGAAAPPTTDASLLTSGTLDDARLSAAVTASLALADTASQPGHGHEVSDIDGLQSALDGKQPTGSYATLVNGTVPADQLPSYVDDVLEFADLAAFPEVGETGKIYTAIDTRKIYRWSGSVYIEISPSEVTSVAGKTGAVTLVPSDVGAQPLLVPVNQFTPSDTTVIPLSANRAYSIQKTSSQNFQLQLPQTAAAGDRISVLRNAGPNAGILAIQRFINTAWQTISTLTDNGQSASFYRNSSNWSLESAPPHTHAIADTTGLQTALDGKQIKTVYSDTAPAHVAGLEWVDTTDLRSYRSYDNLWVEIDRA